MKRFLIILSLLLLSLTSGAGEKIKVACIGDSITYGSWLEDRDSQSYPAVMGAILGEGFEVRNYGISARCASKGSDYPYTKEDFYRQVKEFEPDIITIMLGTNDSKPHNWDVDLFCASYESMVRELKKLPCRPRVILLTPVPAWENNCTIRDSVILNCVLPNIKAVAKRTHTDMVNLYEPFMDKQVLFPDGVHPNAEGARQIAVLVAGACLQRDARKDESYKYPAEQEVRDNLAQWQDMKFGMFIHWGTYSIKGIVESWSICPENIEWQYGFRPEGMPYFEYLKEYEALAGQFNPVEFDPARWAEAASYAGMKYLVFTTKHHDGFNMFDTAQSDYKITSPGCPFSKNPHANIAKELFNAFRAAGMKVGAYYSIADWHHQDYWWDFFPPRNNYINYNPEAFPEKWPRFQNFLTAQIEELTGGDYGELSLLWFDQSNPSFDYSAPVPWEKIASVARGHQPGIMMVARNQGTIYENYLTPEQTIPDEVLDYPWESCITMSNGWSWRENPKYKSTRELLSMLVKIVARGGNFLLNVGPSPRGTLDDEAYERLREIGDWMKVNSEGIYCSKPFPMGNNLFGTTVNGSVYAYYVPADDEAEELPAEIFVPNVASVNARLLGASSVKLKCTPSDGGVKVTIPVKLLRNLPCDHIWCLKFKL